VPGRPPPGHPKKHPGKGRGSKKRKTSLFHFQLTGELGAPEEGEGSLWGRAGGIAFPTQKKKKSRRRMLQENEG